MDGRSTIILALAVVATGLAGCIQNPDWLNSSDLEVSALEHRELADAAAFSWNEDAVLIGILAVETTEQVDPRLAPDQQVGNGLAPAWWYVYCADEAEEAMGDAKGGSADGGEGMKGEMTSVTRAFKVLADGTVSSEDDAAAMAAGFDHEMAQAVGAFELDSSDALAKAAADESFRAAVEGANATMIEGLARHEGRAAWWFGAGSMSGFVVATVDAVTGELVDVKPFQMDFAMPAFEMAARDPATWTAEPVHLEGEGTAAAGDAPAEYAFETVGPMWGEMIVEYRFELPTDGLHLAVLDEEGELVAADHIGGWEGEGAYTFDVQIEEAGAYTLVVEYMSSMVPTGPLGLPVGGAAQYFFTLDLMPGEMPAEDEEEDEP